MLTFALEKPQVEALRFALPGELDVAPRFARAALREEDHREIVMGRAVGRIRSDLRVEATADRTVITLPQLRRSRPAV